MTETTATSTAHVAALMIPDEEGKLAARFNKSVFDCQWVERRIKNNGPIWRGWAVQLEEENSANLKKQIAAVFRLAAAKE